MLDVTLLGTGGMMPLPKRYLTALMCRYNGRMLLIDCGEGTQVTQKMTGYGYKNIDVILITHVHGDHVSGLPGMLLTIGNSGRNTPIVIVGPKGVKEVVESLLIIAREIPFSVEYVELEEEFSEIVVGEFTIQAAAMDHTTTCYGYSVIIKRVGKFIKEKALKNKVPREVWSKLQKNEQTIYNEITYTRQMVLSDDRKSLKVTYLTDTRPNSNAIKLATQSDLFICEGLYGDDTKLEKAMSYKHMCFSEAANIAKIAQTAELWLTHYSPSMSNPYEFEQVAIDIFNNSRVCEDRQTKTLTFID